MGAIQNAINSSIGVAAGLIGTGKFLKQQRTAIEQQTPEAQLELHKQKLEQERQFNILSEEERAQRLDAVQEGMRHATVTGSPADQERKRQLANETADIALQEGINTRQNLLFLDPTTQRAQSYVNQRLYQDNLRMQRERALQYGDDEVVAQPTMVVQRGSDDRVVAQQANDRAANSAEFQGEQAQDLIARLRASSDSSMEELRTILRLAQYRSQDMGAIQDKDEEGKS